MKKTLKVNGVVVGEYEATGDAEADLALMRKFLEDKGLARDVPLPKSMFMQAFAFCRAASVIYERDVAREPPTLPMVAPFVVNATFATELYLKTLHQVEGRGARGHDLLDLYDRLPEATRDRPTHSAVKHGAEFGVPDASLLTFRSTIESLANAFTEWRYWYETGQASLVKVQPLILVMKALDAVCREQGAA